MWKSLESQFMILAHFIRLKTGTQIDLCTTAWPHRFKIYECDSINFYSSEFTCQCGKVIYFYRLILWPTAISYLHFINLCQKLLFYGSQEFCKIIFDLETAHIKMAKLLSIYRPKWSKKAKFCSSQKFGFKDMRSEVGRACITATSVTRWLNYFYIFAHLQQ